MRVKWKPDVILDVQMDAKEGVDVLALMDVLVVALVAVVVLAKELVLALARRHALVDVEDTRLLM